MLVLTRPKVLLLALAVVAVAAAAVLALRSWPSDTQERREFSAGRAKRNRGSWMRRLRGRCSTTPRGSSGDTGLATR